MSIKSNRKDHLGKGISSLLGNFSYDMADELLGELEKNKQKHEEEQMPEPVKEKPAEKIIPKIAEVKPVEIKPAETKVIDENQVLYVSIDNIQVNPDQPRKSFDENSLQELAESVRKQGIGQGRGKRNGKDCGDPLDPSRDSPDGWSSFRFLHFTAEVIVGFRCNQGIIRSRLHVVKNFPQRLIRPGIPFGIFEQPAVEIRPVVCSFTFHN